MLERCKEEVYPEADNADFYIAVGIWSSDNIAVDGADGTKQEVPWSIAICTFIYQTANTHQRHDSIV